MTITPEVTRLTATIRFVRGYRYLDRAGEALIELEDALDKDWLTGEASPTAGIMRNFKLGLVMQFNSDALVMTQAEFISFEHFQDQVCKTYDVLRKVLEIDRILTPVAQVILQVGFDEVDKAEQYLLSLDLCHPDIEVLSLLGTRQSSIQFASVAAEEITERGIPISRRRRLDARVVRQEKMPDFDERIMRRLPLIQFHQHSGIGELMKLRRQHPKLAVAAAQFDLENIYEGEYRTRNFDMPQFLNDSHDWSLGWKSVIGRRDQRFREEGKK